jgi:Ca2+-binding RTX toxin-like protein
MATYNYNGHTYSLSNAGTWTEAEAQAVSLGGHLVTINDQAENDWIINTLLNNQPMNDLWIGYTDESKEGSWQWISGEQSSYTQWSPNEPNNGVGYNVPSENYANLVRSWNNKWNDSDGKNPSVVGIIEINNAKLTWNEILTKSGGYYSTFADLSKAAYQLAANETTGQGINYVKPYADEAWARVNANWNVLTSDNLNVNSGTLGTDGIFHNANAAAFAAQCENTLVLSFRGTNDNDGAFLTTNGDRTPDVYDWTHMAEHYAKFQSFIDAVDKYVTANGIQNVYVTGHSLGGAMVLAYMIDHPKISRVNYEAVTFAAPAYDIVGVSDNRIVSIEMNNDLVPDTGGYHAGHIVTVNSPLYHGNQVNDSTQAYNGTSDYHSMDIYMETAHALDSQLPDTSINTNTSLHGLNLTSFDGVWEAQVALPMLEATGTQNTWDNAIAPHYVAMTGNNTLSGAGKNIMLGGVGDDSYDVDDALDVIIEKANAGKDGVTSSISFTLPDNVENLTLKNGTSLLGFNQNLNGTGNTSANVLNGNNAKNTLTGFNGNDIFSGAKGDDILIGGLGKDKLIGGAGADTFKFDTVKDSGLTPTTRDVITDFNHAQGDKIDLSGIDANTAVKGNNAFLTVENGFTDVTFNLTNALYFNKTNHILYGNNDTDAAADFSILLTGVTTLSTSDFIL